MTIVELTRYDTIQQLAPYTPFVYVVNPVNYQLADFWTTTFGVTDESQVGKLVTIPDVIFLYTQKLSKVNSVSSCQTQERSFYFDTATQKLYIHVDHDYSNYLADDIYQYGRVYGYSDDDVVYIDDVEYRPLLNSIPSIAQQEDIQEYNKQSFIVGDTVFNNEGGDFDELKDEPIYGNDINIFNIPDNQDEYTRSDMTQLASLYVENYDFGIQQFSIASQDKRKADNILIPGKLFSTEDYPNIDPNLTSQVIPLVYGPVRYTEAYPVDGESSGDVTYRAGILLTSTGTIQIQQGDSWVDVTPNSTDLTTGSFTLDYANCRDGGTTIGDVLTCRLFNCEGIQNTYSSDVIKDLNERELGIPYNSSNYNTTEWEAEETQLSEVGIVFKKQVKLYDAIRTIQNGSNKGFRYETNSTGLRTIRINDFNRAKRFYIPKERIQNITSLSIRSENDLLAANVSVNYSRNFFDDTALIYEYNDPGNYVVSRNRQSPTIQPQTYLTTESDAEDRAQWSYDRFKDVPRVVDVDLMGSDYTDLRLYDMIAIELSTSDINADDMTYEGGRLFFGVWNAQVIGINPRLKTNVNKVRILLTSEYIPVINFGLFNDKPVYNIIKGNEIDFNFVLE